MASTCIRTLFPYTTLFRSRGQVTDRVGGAESLLALPSVLPVTLDPISEIGGVAVWRDLGGGLVRRLGLRCLRHQSFLVGVRPKGAGGVGMRRPPGKGGRPR